MLSVQPQFHKHTVGCGAYKSKTIFKFSFSWITCSLVNLPSFFIKRLLSIARGWSTKTSLNFDSRVFFKWILNISASGFMFVVIGHTIVDKCVSLSKSVWIITTGLVLPGSVSSVGFKSASQMSYCLYFIHKLFEFCQHFGWTLGYKFAFLCKFLF